MNDNSNVLFDTSKFVRRTLPEQSKFEESCKDILPVFKLILEKSFELTLKERSNKKPNFLDKNWEATDMSGNIKGFLIEHFPLNIKIDSSGRFYYKNENYILYFKKLNDKLIPNNIKTNNSQKIYGQYALPLEESSPIVFIGYTTNDSWDALMGTYAVCLRNDERIWVTCLNDFEITSQTILNTTPIQPISDDLSSLVKVKEKKIS